MLLKIVHTTRYRYAGWARESQNEVRVMPRTDAHQKCLGFRLTVTPEAEVRWEEVETGRLHRFDVPDWHQELIVVAKAEVLTCLTDPFVRMNFTDPDDDAFAERLPTTSAPFLVSTARVPLHDPALAADLDDLAARARKNADGPTTAHFLIALTHLLHAEFPYSPGVTGVDASLAQILAFRRGVCQDVAHLFLAVCRRSGIPSRYVSGYLYTGGGLTSGDVMHAWVECLLPDAYAWVGGSPWIWRGFDPTNDLVAGKSFIKTHVGLDYDDVSPIRGGYLGAPCDLLEVSVHVTQEADALAANEAA